MPHVARISGLPDDFDALVALSLREQFPAMQRMREQFESGENRFDRPGEALFEARDGARLVGACGLNRDPYTNDASVGRVRHLYVDPAFRRRGVGRLLVAQVLEHAAKHFERVRLRTLREDASRFYLALGFRQTEAEPDATHALDTALRQSSVAP
jgi:GNAT superfamily N-acetyltransferase